MKITSIRRTIRNTKRLAEIIKVLSKFGFQQLVVDSGMLRILGGTDEQVPPPQSPSSLALPRSVRIRMALEELGPTFIKLGQLLSTRPDLIPGEWANEFKKLQDSCRHVPFTEIHEVLELEFPGRMEEIFDTINETPLATASIAQVHSATTKDGSRVVIKVLKPGARKLLEEDMALLETLAQVLEQYFSDLGYSPTAVAKEFSRELLKEINLVIEGQSTERLRRYFDDDENIFFPKIYWYATTRNVLTMEKIEGRLLSTIDPKTLPGSERRKIVSNGTDAVFKQCLRFGFFHADPHPGNIFLLEGGKICFIDCGMTGQLDRRTTDQLIRLVTGVIKGDIDRLCRVILELTTVDPLILEKREFRLELRHLTGQFQNIDLGHLHIAALLSDFFSMLQRYHIQCPGDLMLLTKALTIIESVAEQFDPTFDVLAHVEPQIKTLVMDRYSMSAIRKRISRTLFSSLELLEEMPRDIQRFFDHARHSRFTLNLELKRIEHLAENIDNSSRLMGIAMIIAALIVGSSILILADAISREPGFLGTLGLIGLILSGINTAAFITAFLLPKKKK
ncbi:ABC1 kinase family protein [Desulforhopalus singaporensis]|uniref:2-octaprenylphenol hydroxylase n=1 Tax=Desulforhopalus singaporensis TaxID=91360 RepID=A0A1H0JUG4_9BACT|nr:AarF/UbiB family protein [Desulforhopalus singaporensis]SDO47159.1 2-octaprenylphenol hydroxylase [Desulforhopalus singaporensis]